MEVMCITKKQAESYLILGAALGSQRNRRRTSNRGAAKVNYELGFLHIKVFYRKRH